MWNRDRPATVWIDDAFKTLATSGDPAAREQSLGAIARRGRECADVLIEESLKDGKLGDYAETHLAKLEEKLLNRKRRK